MKDIQPLPKMKRSDRVRVEYTQPRDVQHLRRCLNLAREVGLCETMHELLLAVAHLSREAKEHAERLYQVEVKDIKKRVAEKKDDNEDGLALCELLNGTIEGSSCRYKKYEVGAGNKKLVWDRLTPLDALRMDIHVRNQYTPSKDVWDRAKE